VMRVFLNFSFYIFSVHLFYKFKVSNFSIKKEEGVTVRPQHILYLFQYLNISKFIISRISSCLVRTGLDK